MKSKRLFSKLLDHMKKNDSSKYMAEKQSPQAEQPGKLTPEDAAEKIVKTRKAMKRSKMPVKPGNLYDEL